jgi:tetratricopeptide (TPR) repeat protein
MIVFTYEQDYDVAREYLELEKEIMDARYSKKNAAKIAKFIKSFPSFPEAYWLDWVHESKQPQYLGESSASRSLIRAYDVAIQKVHSLIGGWPDRLEWGWLENRCLLRIFQGMAEYYWECGAKYLAEDLFRRILTMNPNDNQGIRYSLVYLLKGKKFEQFERDIDSDPSGQKLERFYQNYKDECGVVFSWEEEE